MKQVTIYTILVIGIFLGTMIKSRGFYSEAFINTGWMIMGVYMGLGARYLTKGGRK